MSINWKKRTGNIHAIIGKHIVIIDIQVDSLFIIQDCRISKGFKRLGKFEVEKKTQKKLMGQSKEVKQNRVGVKNFDICFSIIFDCYCKGFIS